MYIWFMTTTTTNRGELLRAGAILLVTSILYQAVTRGMLTKQTLDFHLWGKVYPVSSKWLFPAFLLLVAFFTYFFREHRYYFKRVGWNIFLIISGLTLIYLAFLFAKNYHSLYLGASRIWDNMPPSIPISAATPEQVANPAPMFKWSRNAFLLLDTVIFACLAYLWYYWAETPSKK